MTTELLDEKVLPVGKKEGLNLTQLALSYILSFSEISTIIPGIRTKEQVQENTQELKKLSDDDKGFLQNLSTEWAPVVQLMEAQG